jgi:hypothetical protein
MTELKPVEPQQTITPRVIIKDFDIATVAVRVVDIDVSFGSLVVLFLKCLLAAIPAMIILGIVSFFFWAFLIALATSGAR